MNRIKELRKRKGLSQKELGEELNRTVSAISKWERGEREPSNDDVLRLCRLFRVTSDYLQGYTDTNNGTVELHGAQLPKSLRDAGLESVELLREYIDENGGIHPDVLRELMRLVAAAKLLPETDDHSR